VADQARRGAKKKQKPAKPEPAWRKFEKLVAGIEAILAPHGAVVRWNDRVPLLRPIRARAGQVDASIRFRVGSVDVLITIECRKRRHKEDIRWIEEMMSKKQLLGAARTILVSPIGYSAGAIDLAREEGIDLRVLSEVDPEDILKLIRLETLLRTKVCSRVVGFSFGVAPNGDPGSLEFNETPDGTDVLDQHIFSCPSIPEGETPRYWLERFMKADPSWQTGAPSDGSTVRRLLTVTVPPGHLYLRTTQGDRSILRLQMHLDVWAEVRVINMSHKGTVQYSDPDKALLQHTTFMGRDDELELALSVQQEAGSPDFRFQAEIIASTPMVNFDFHFSPELPPSPAAPGPEPAPPPGPAHP
jgi:hypothetical protein